MGAGSSTPEGSKEDLTDNPPESEKAKPDDGQVHQELAAECGQAGSTGKAGGLYPKTSHSFASTKRTTIDSLPDEILLKVLAAVSASAESPADVVSPTMTCRRWRFASREKEVLRRSSRGAVGVRARQWTTGSYGFLSRLVDAGCLEACFMLGMILFYCIPEAQLQGGRLLLQTARAGHAGALYNAGIMSFNGSGWGKDFKDAKTGVAMCARAAALGHTGAMRELGHCLIDGYGIRQNLADGWSLLLKAQLAELATGSVESGAVFSPPRLLSDPLGNVRPLSEEQQAKAVAHFLATSAAVPPQSPSHQPSQQKASCPDNHAHVAATNAAKMKLSASIPVNNARTPEPISDISALGSDVPVLEPTAKRKSAISFVLKVLQLVQSSPPTTLPCLHPLLTQLDSPISAPAPHPAHVFLREWFESRQETPDIDAHLEVAWPLEAPAALCGKLDEDEQLRLAGVGCCSSRHCSRRESRPLEFWRCASCWDARYCSKSCQTRDWKERHSSDCDAMALHAA